MPLLSNCWSISRRSRKRRLMKTYSLMI